MRPHLVSVILFTVLLSGCTDGDPTDGPRFGIDAALLDPEEFIVLERAATGEIRWHEEPSGDPFTLEEVTGANTWEPRDVTMTYHGVQPVHDEWARPVPGYVLRYSPMELYVDSIDFTLGSLSLTGHWEEGHREVLFDASDARWMGVTDLESQVRSFAFADHRDPLAGGYEANLYLVFTYMALDGDLSKGVRLNEGTPYAGTVRFTPTDERPLPGVCQPYEITYEFDDPPEPAAPSVEEAKNGPYRSLACLESDGWTVWSWEGDDVDHMAITRLSAPPALPPLQGEPLPPLEYPARPWEDQELLLPVLPTVRIPPSAYAGDWADQMRPLVRALPTSADFLRYQQTHEDVQVSEFSRAFPYFGNGLIVPLLGDVIPPLFETTAWLFTSDPTSEDFAWWFIDSRYGGQEEPDIHLNSRGAVFEDAWSYLDPPLVAIGDVQLALEQWAPINPGFLSFSIWPDFSEFDPGIVAATWMAFGSCFSEPKQDLFVYLSGVQGQLLATGAMFSEPNGCSSGANTGGIASRLGQHSGRWFPPTPQQPGFFVSDRGDVTLLRPALGA